MGGPTCVLRPDSVLPLTARKKASMAVRLPKAYRRMNASSEQPVMYMSIQVLVLVFLSRQMVT